MPRFQKTHLHVCLNQQSTQPRVLATRLTEDHCTQSISAWAATLASGDCPWAALAAQVFGRSITTRHSASRCCWLRPRCNTNASKRALGWRSPGCGRGVKRRRRYSQLAMPCTALHCAPMPCHAAAMQCTGPSGVMLGLRMADGESLNAARTCYVGAYTLLASRRTREPFTHNEK